ncbi:MAG: pabA 1 [Sporomusa sp.]|nr:pabA 1 [Sporomusa sp.]MDF2874215.1 pabA 1 [Sporomusa sp.]
MILMIDNYDSFVYNLVQYLGEMGEDIRVFRNNKLTLAQIEDMRPDHIILSPGPCTPNEAGISLELIKYFKGRIPILGVCLGHQAIGQAFGGDVVRAPRLMHGKTSLVYHDGKGVFSGLKNPLSATRYHSLIVKKETLPDCFEITAETELGEIMGIRHKEYLIEGVQFHPESILTEAGHAMLENFLTMNPAWTTKRKGPAGK